MRNKMSFTTTEVLISSVIIVILFACTIGAFMMVKGLFRDKIAEYGLQQSSNTILTKIIRGYKEGGNIVGLRSAVSFSLPVVTPAGSRIDYVGKDGNTRSYFLSVNTIQYSSPTQWPNQRTIYTAPAGATIVLRFWYASADRETAGIYFALLQPAGKRTVSGSVSTYVNLRNMPR